MACIFKTGVVSMADRLVKGPFWATTDWKGLYY